MAKTPGKISLEKLAAQLESFGLKQVAPKIADLLEDAERYEYTHRQFLEKVLSEEVNGRNQKKRNRNYASTHFPPSPKPLDEFDPDELRGGITRTQINQLKDFDWIDGNATYYSSVLRAQARLILLLELHWKP